MHGRIIMLGVGNGGCVTVSGGEQGQRWWWPNPPKQQTWVGKLACPACYSPFTAPALKSLQNMLWRTSESEIYSYVAIVCLWKWHDNQCVIMYNPHIIEIKTYTSGAFIYTPCLTLFFVPRYSDDKINSANLIHKLPSKTFELQVMDWIRMRMFFCFQQKLALWTHWYFKIPLVLKLQI